MQALMTIGYEGANMQDFLATLKQAGVTTLLDVRELPLSRRRGFSKQALRDHLESVGVQYRHERDLGSPREIRHQLHTDGDYRQYFASFTTYLKKQAPLLKTLAGDIDGRVALMCFERDPTTCHRSVVAKHLESLTGLRTKHLGVADGCGSNNARRGTRQSVSAT